MPKSIRIYCLAALRVTKLFLITFCLGLTSLFAQSKETEKKTNNPEAPVKPAESKATNDRPRIAKPKAKLIATISDSELRKELDEKEGTSKPVSRAAAITVSSVSANEALERKVFNILNRNRADNGLQPLIWSEDMARVARVHSDNMARFDFFSHVGLDGKLVSDRADDLGFGNWRSIGENIAFNQGYEDPVEQACMRWMQSPSHRENILNKKWREVGVGVTITQDGKYYFTEVFVLR